MGSYYPFYIYHYYYWLKYTFLSSVSYKISILPIVYSL